MVLSSAPKVSNIFLRKIFVDTIFRIYERKQIAHKTRSVPKQYIAYCFCYKSTAVAPSFLMIWQNILWES